MGRVAIVTDSTADLPPGVAEAHGIRVVPLFVRFGADEFKAGVDLSTEEFWARMTAPDAPFPATAAAPPGMFAEAFGEAIAAGADGVVCVTVGSRLSATHTSASIAAQSLPAGAVRVVDSASASMGLGMLAIAAAEMAAAGDGIAAIADRLESLLPAGQLFIALDTLEYLRKGGRISTARAAIGTVLSVKPIITLVDGLVETVDRPRTRARARERVLELLSAEPVDWLSVVSTPPADPAPFRDELLARLPGGVDPSHVWSAVIGASVGPHIGPGCLGAISIRRT